jgi:Glycosyl hydrolases family 43
MSRSFNLMKLSAIWMAAVVLVTVSELAVGAHGDPRDRSGTSGASPGEFEKIVIDNANPRRDIDSHILDVHDGCLQRFNDKYYLYGTRYGKADGWGTTNKYVVYSSPNLTDWTNEGVILKDLPPKTYYRPCAIYSEKARKYVLWYNTGGKMGVATADRPDGPFAELNSDVPLSHKDTGDLGLFVDSDGTAYVTYSYDDGADAKKTFPISKEPIPHHQIAVEKLTDNYLGSTGQVVAPIAGNSEAPALFRRNDLYYLLFDNTCAICAAGSGVRVYIAKSPLGPFVYKGNINRLGSKSRELRSPWTFPGTGREDAIVKAQQAYIAKLPGKDGDIYIWMGDRWHSAPDGILGHDFQYWGVLSFDSDGMIRQIQKKKTWTIDITSR